MMTAITLAKTLDMPKSDWLELRRKGIGGSDAAAILGLNPWKSPMDVWLEKTGEYDDDHSDRETEKMYWGNVLEDVVAKEFTARTGLKVRRRNAILSHKDRPFMIATIDRLVVGRQAGLECKTAGQYAAEDWEMGLPDYYMPQVQHYMAVTGYPAWYVAVLIGGQEFKYFKVARDESYTRQLVEAETEFWHMVEAGTPPTIDGTRASTEMVKKRYPEADKGKEIELPFEAFGLVQQYEKACEEEKKVQLIKDEAANRLKDMLGEAERGSIYDRQVIWQNVSTKKLDTKTLQSEQPDIYKKYTQESAYRRFSVK